MSGYDKPLTPRQIAVTKDEDIDFSDIPELDETFWQRAELAEPDLELRISGSVGIDSRRVLQPREGLEKRRPAHRGRRTAHPRPER